MRNEEFYHHLILLHNVVDHLQGERSYDDDYYYWHQLRFLRSKHYSFLCLVHFVC